MREEAFRVRRKERKVKEWRKGKEKERRIGQEETHACSKGEVHSLKSDVSIST
jgi:hypothetical protein